MPLRVKDEAELYRILGKEPPKSAAPPKPSKSTRKGNYSYEINPAGGYSIWEHRDGLVYLVGLAETEELAQRWTASGAPIATPNAGKCSARRSWKIALTITILSWLLMALRHGFQAFVKRPSSRGIVG